ncbi:putative NusB antitermination factor [Helianthus anomalus]
MTRYVTIHVFCDQNEPAGRILELSFRRLAMSEIDVLGTRHQIDVLEIEALDLAKRFCVGSAPRIVNGCVRTFIKDFKGNSVAQKPDSKNPKRNDLNLLLNLNLVSFEPGSLPILSVWAMVNTRRIQIVKGRPD